MVAMNIRLLALLLIAASAVWAQKYSGPKPPKTDVVYLLHASTLVETEAGEAKQQDGKKDTTTYVVAGTASTAKTPLAEPIFLLASDKLAADSLELYRFEVKNGRRELSTVQKSRNGPRPLRMSVTKIDNGLYRIEASETLENGEYSISPTNSNKVFCFQVY
jgi:hypothetical protein